MSQFLQGLKRKHYLEINSDFSVIFMGVSQFDILAVLFLCASILMFGFSAGFLLKSNLSDFFSEPKE